ncbi:hypothetical protein Dvina_38665 [Dactylosporangium vinaceum]|uniref:S1 motif domain-containing protein n=1 Tax=Dactylosporangium vinaceum TaxID=53362 RepID=A0ABV5ML89_9ACTN|nr:hypothetical protein [Dactylosporangium vinaceum]UAB94069.1 hypothetical protein Dvina_38665 [Dactylosporangium vinaceum]
MASVVRCEVPKAGVVFVAVPHGGRRLADGTLMDFDALYNEIYEPTLQDCGLTVERADDVFAGDGTVEVLWSGVQHAELVVVDCSAPAPLPALVLGQGMVLGKRIIVLAQREQDLPRDLAATCRVLLYAPSGLRLAALARQLKSQVERARDEPVVENDLVPLEHTGTQWLPGTVTEVAKDWVAVQVVDEGRRRRLVLGSTDVDYARTISDMRRLFRVGERLDGAATVGLDGVARYTLLADQIDPWPRIVAEYPVGRTYTGRVISLREGVGAFVSVAHGINGYVRYAQARQANLSPDMDVDVEIRSVDPAERKIRLKLHALAEPAGAGPAAAMPLGAVAAVTPLLPPIGARLEGRVVQATPERQERRGGGFVLLRLAGYEDGPLAMLHCTRMSETLRDELNGGRLSTSERVVAVQVLHTDAEHRRIQLAQPRDDDAVTADVA